MKEMPCQAQAPRGSQKGQILRGSVGYGLLLGKSGLSGVEIGASIGEPSIRIPHGLQSYQSDPRVSFDVSARLGITPSPELLLFGKAGWSTQRVTIRRASGSAVRMEKIIENGFLWGAGAEYH